MMKPIKVFEAFSGYGSQSLALKRLGIPFEVVAISEIDDYAIAAYKLLHGDVLNLGDITQIELDTLPPHDLFTYSFPCTDISLAGKREGFKKGSGTRSSTLWDCERIIEYCRPKYLILENVKNLVGKAFITAFNNWLFTLERYGYKNYWKILNACDFNIPQNRERVFVVSVLESNFRFPKKIPLTRRLKDVLEPVVDEKYFLKKELQDRFEFKQFGENIVGTTKPDNPKIDRHAVYDPEQICGAIRATDYKQPKQIIIRQNRLGGVFDTDTKHQAGSIWDTNGLAPTLDTMQGGWRQPCIYDNYRIRKLMPIECFRLMDVDDDDFKKLKGISDSQLYKMSGNSICVGVLVEIFKNLFDQEEEVIREVDFPNECYLQSENLSIFDFI